MSIYCLSCKKHTESQDIESSETTKNRILVRGRCSECGGKKCTFQSNKKRGKGIDLPKTDLNDKDLHAHFSNAVYEKPEEREAYLVNKGLDYTIDHDLSDLHKAVFVGKNDKVVSAHRGTYDLKDVVTDIPIALDTQNLFKKTGRYDDARKHTLKVIRKYGKDNLTLTGHSLGASIASNLSKEFLVPSHNFNTGSGPADITQGLRRRIRCTIGDRCKFEKENVHYYRVTSDPISLSSVTQTGKHYQQRRKRGHDPHSTLNFIRS